MPVVDLSNRAAFLAFLTLGVATLCIGLYERWKGRR
jgi:hypothetical protein